MPPEYRSDAVFEAPAVVAGLDDVAVMGEPVEERGGHLGVAEDGGPFAEGEIGGDDDGALLVEPADQVEEQLAAGLGEGQMAEFVEDYEVEARELLGELADPALAAFRFERVTRSVVLKKRALAPPLMQARAIAMARWVLPVPVPPTRTTLRC